jgi:hypothetical protein
MHASHLPALFCTCCAAVGGVLLLAALAAAVVYAIRAQNRVKPVVVIQSYT